MSNQFIASAITNNSTTMSLLRRQSKKLMKQESSNPLFYKSIAEPKELQQQLESFASANGISPIPERKKRKSLRKKISKRFTQLRGSISAVVGSDSTTEFFDLRGISLHALSQFWNSIKNQATSHDIKLYVALEDLSPSVKKGTTILLLDNAIEDRWVGLEPYTNQSIQFNPNQVRQKNRIHWTVEDVNEYIIKPKCLRFKSSFIGQFQRKDISQPQKCTFVSHSRRTPFEKLVNTLNDLHQDHQLPDEFVWIDIFGTNQALVESEENDVALGENLFTNQLVLNTILKFDHMMVLLDPSLPQMYSTLNRAWCIWEMFCGMKRENCFDVAILYKDNSKIDELICHFSVVLHQIESLDLSKAFASKQADKQNILSQVTLEDSIDTMNVGVRQKLLILFAQLLEQTAKKHAVFSNTFATNLSYGVRNSVLGHLQHIFTRRASKIGMITDQSEVQHALTQPNTSTGVEVQQDDEPNWENIAQLYEMAATLYIRLKNTPEAIRLYQQSVMLMTDHFGEVDPRTMDSLGRLSSCFVKEEKYQEAKKVYKNLYGLTCSFYGVLHPQTEMVRKEFCNVLIKLHCFDEIERMQREYLQASLLNQNSAVEKTMETIRLIGWCLEKQSKFVEAESTYRQLFRVTKEFYGDESPLVPDALDDIARCLKLQGNYKSASPLFSHSLMLRKKLLGEEHPQVADSYDNLAQLLKNQGKYVVAEEYNRIALAIRRKSFREDHVDVISSQSHLALLLHNQGKLDEAEVLYREDVNATQKKYGDVHPEFAVSLNNLALLLDNKNTCVEAIQLFEDSIAIFKQAKGENHPDVAGAMNNMANSLNKIGRYAEAEPLYRGAIDIYRNSFGPQHPSVAILLNNLASVMEKQGQTQEASTLTSGTWSTRNSSTEKSNGYSGYFTTTSLICTPNDRDVEKNKNRLIVGLWKAKNSQIF